MDRSHRRHSHPGHARRNLHLRFVTVNTISASRPHVRNEDTHTSPDDVHADPITSSSTMEAHTTPHPAGHRDRARSARTSHTGMHRPPGPSAPGRIAHGFALPRHQAVVVVVTVWAWT